MTDSPHMAWNTGRDHPNGRDHRVDPANRAWSRGGGEGPVSSQLGAAEQTRS
jgi:hypothetical protein